MQKRHLKYAILGLLYNENLTGYDLYLKFGGPLSEFWSAKHSQIYPELKKLAEEGVVSYDIEIAGTSLEKKVYSITEAGREDFLNWLSTIEPMQATPKDVFRLRLFFAAYLEPEARLAMLSEHLEEHRLRLAHLRRKNEDVFAVIPEKDSALFFDYLVWLNAVMREETTCRWLETCIALCAE